MNKEVNYKNKKRYKSAKYPIRQPLFFVGLIWILSKIMLIGKKYKIWGLFYQFFLDKCTISFYYIDVV